MQLFLCHNPRGNKCARSLRVRMKWPQLKASDCKKKKKNVFISALILTALNIVVHYLFSEEDILTSQNRVMNTE